MKRILACLLLSLAILSHAQIKLAYRKLAASKKGDYKARVEYPVFGGGGVANFAAAAWKSTAVRGYRKFLKDAKQFRAEEKKGGITTAAEYYYDGSPKITSLTIGLISGYMQMGNYMGGAHGMQWYEPMNVGMVRGKAAMIRLRDILRGGVDPTNTISPLVIKKLKVKKAAWVEEGTVKALTRTQLDSFVINSMGLLYLFEPYAMGSYAEGPYEVQLTWAELREWIDPNGPLLALRQR